MSAGTVLVAGILALPFAGGLGHSAHLVSTGPGPLPAPTATTAPAPAEPTSEPPAPPPPTAAAPQAPPPAPEPAVAPVEGVGAASPDGDALASAAPDGATDPEAPLPAPAPRVADVPVAAPAPAPPPAPVAPAAGEHVWAVTIGINDYPGTRSDLLGADNDAIVLHDALVHSGVPADQVRLVLDHDATVTGILDAVDWLVANAGPDDTAVFLYAGHIRDFGGGTEALITAERGYIADWYLGQRLAPLQAHAGWMVVAGCYGGGFDELLAPGRVLTAGAGPGQLAYEDSGLGMSYLGEYLVRRGFANGEAGAPTVQADVAWAMARLAEDYPQYQLWNVDESTGTISLDGVDRDAAAPGDGQSPPASTPPPTTCLLGVLCG